MDRVRKQIGLPLSEGSNRCRYTGKGITVAVLDTGVVEHPDLLGRIVGFKDFVDGRKFAYDDSGHGTHVCGIIGGSGKVSGGRYQGIATEANFIVGKVLDQDGEGSADNMMRGLEWILDIRLRYHIKVLNISVGINNIRDKEKETRLREFMEFLWDCGIIVVCAAGNSGPGNGSISSLGKSRKLITVGCHDGEFYKNMPGSCGNYSGRGDLFSPLRKPDIVAPGTNIVSCNAFYESIRGKVRGGYTAKSGTSMATPIISGIAAIFLEKYPHLKCDDFRKRLTYTATDLGEPWNKQGWGMVNAERLFGG